MPSSRLLPTAELHEVFSQSINSLGGRVTEVYQDSARYYARAVLPTGGDVATGDRIQAGVALRSNECGAVVHPYTFREVCKNGAIVAQAVGSQTVAFDDFATAEEAAGALAEAVAECGSAEVFQGALGQMRSAREVSADFLINLLPMLARFLPDSQRDAFAREAMSRLFRDQDQSLYGLFNAVTSIARDERDPERKWRLEELGGGVLARVRPEPTPGNVSARRPVMV